MKNLLKNTGSIALISTLIISAILILLVVGMSELTISGSYQNFNNISGKTNYYAADTCLEEALIRLEADTSFTSATIAIDDDTTCTINRSGNTITITANYLDFSETYQGQYSITTTGQANNIRLLNWQEI